MAAQPLLATGTHVGQLASVSKTAAVAFFASHQVSRALPWRCTSAQPEYGGNSSKSWLMIAARGLVGNSAADCLKRWIEVYWYRTCGQWVCAPLMHSTGRLARSWRDSYECAFKVPGLYYRTEIITWRLITDMWTRGDVD